MNFSDMAIWTLCALVVSIGFSLLIGVCIKKMRGNDE